MVDGGQGEYVRVPLADGTLVSTREVPDDDAGALAAQPLGRDGHRLARRGRRRGCGRATPWSSSATARSGSAASSPRPGWAPSAIIAMSRHASRQRLARDFGATDVVEERGDEAVEAAVQGAHRRGGRGRRPRVRRHRTSRCTTAIAVARPGATVGYVGVPHGVEYPVRDMFARNVGIAGGIAPARQYLPQLRDDVLAGRDQPGPVFDLEVPLAEVAEAYAAMDERRAIKSLIRP